MVKALSRRQRLTLFSMAVTGSNAIEEYLMLLDLRKR